MMKNGTFYSVVMNLPLEVGDCFTYRSEGELTPGERVTVELRNRDAVGFVAGAAEPVENAKSILMKLDPIPLLTPDLLETTRWLSRHLFVPWYSTIEAAIPGGVKRKVGMKGKTRSVLRAALSANEIAGKFSKDERISSALLFVLEHPDSVSAAELMRRFELTRSRIDTLLKNKVLVRTEVSERRSPFSRSPIEREKERVILTSEQSVALEKTLSGEKELLLSGVTGSGKTEVYLRALEEKLAKGEGAIVLVPEISLTPQTVDRFRRRFGETVAILHSQLSDGERHDEWLRIRRGEARVAVGARSAVFAPVERLGIIVIDEAHENSYKQNENPRYHAIDVARKRCEIAGATLVLGTATPTCEMIHSARATIRLTERVARRPLPKVTVVDMRRELQEGNRSVFSGELHRSIRDTLKRREQAILFLNRRGHTSFMLCRSCGATVPCPLCSVSLTYHEGSAGKGRGILVCHYCNHRAAPPAACPACGSKAIRGFGAGTERIEEETRKKFPEARIVRMDADTTVRKDSHRTILDAFAAGDYDILIGTQMIGKGLDLPNVTLVGVMAADSSLHIPDFRSAERTFSILVQVIGRAGRSEKGGRAVVQTYAPAHYAVRTAAAQDLDAFAKTELGIRKAAELPPFRRIIQWTFEAEDAALVRESASRAAEILADAPGAILGPAPAPFERIRGRTRWQVRWHFPSNLSEEEIRSRVTSVPREKNLRVLVDVDPVDLL